MNTRALKSFPLLASLLFSTLGITSCVSISSLIPGKQNDEPTEVISETSKYGFQKENKTAEEEILIDRFTQDKENLDLAIDNTKQLIFQSYGRPFLPELYLRLAELYAEKSRVVFFLRRLEMGERGKTRSVTSVEANSLKEKTVETYMQIISHFPKFVDLDKVHFFLAHELRELAKYPEMVKQYQTILSEYKHSQYVPESLLLLGDYAYENKKIDRARDYYQQVLNYPESSAIIIARYKLAWVHISKRNFKEALRLFELSVTNERAGEKVDVDTYNRVDIRLEALTDMAFSYSQVYKETKPGEASKYFKKIAWSRPSYILVLEKLANRYLIKRKWDNAAYIYRELSELQFNGNKLLEYAENIFTCVSELKNYNNAERDVAIIAKALGQSRYSVHVDETEKQELLERYEVYARDIATRIHEKARRSKKVEDFAVAAEVYKDFIHFFDQSPKYVEMHANYAETLFSSESFIQAGKIYEQIASRHEDLKIKHDPMYSATVSYYTALKSRDNLNYYQVAYARDGLRDMGSAYVQAYPKSDKVPDIRFNVAWIKYDEGKFDEAITEFTAFVKRYPKGENAKAAVALIIDAMHLTENYEGLLALEQEFSNLPLDNETKLNLAKVAKSSQAKIVTGMIVESINDWDSGKDTLLEYADNSKTANMKEQALNALFVSSEEHGDIETMQVAGKSIIKRFPQTQNSENALKVLIDLTLSTGQFRTLSSYLEEYVRQFPKSATSVDFLYQAAQIRASMKQYKKAIYDYKAMLSSYKLSTSMKKDVTLAIIDIEKQRGNTSAALKTLEKNSRLFANVEFNAMAAELSTELRQYKKSNKYLSRAKKNYSAGRNAEQADKLANASYQAALRALEGYMDTQLGGAIDNQIVARKTQRLEALQDKFLSVLNYKSPRFSILACYRIYEINREYSNFLKTAPIPEDFSAEEKQQYTQIINERAKEYSDEAQQYLQTGKDLSKKIKSFDADIALYDETTGKASRSYGRFGQSRKPKPIGWKAMKDPVLRDLHDRLFNDANDTLTLMNLAKAYKQKGDLGQSMVITRKLLGNANGIGRKQRAEAYALMGSLYLEFGEDKLARDTLAKALEIDSSNFPAIANLAGLYQHYGYHDEAARLYKQGNGSTIDNNARSIIHPRAQEMLNVSQ